MLKLSIIANIALIVISILLTFKAFPIKKRRIINLLIIFVIAVPIFLVIYPNFVPIGSTSCNNLIEYEAESVSAAMASYFSEPDHTKLPTINDLEHCEGYIPPSKRKSPRIATNNVKESELVVFTREKPNNEYEIWVVAGKGKCPAGVAYVKKMGGAKGEWYKSYEEK